LNVVAGKYDRCPHCGKWSLVRRVDPRLLRKAAEAFTAGQEQEPNAPLDVSQSFSKQLDESRFDNL
jgi:hypothetical protein